MYINTMENKKQKRCKCGCGQIIKGHPNKKFFNTKHKDKYHNFTNPRGYYAHLNDDYIDIEDTFSLGDPYSLGQE